VCVRGLNALHFYPASRFLGENRFAFVSVCACVSERGREGKRVCVCVDLRHSIFVQHVLGENRFECVCVCLCVCVCVCARARVRERV